MENARVPPRRRPGLAAPAPPWTTIRPSHPRHLQLEPVADTVTVPELAASPGGLGEGGPGVLGWPGSPVGGSSRTRSSRGRRGGSPGATSQPQPWTHPPSTLVHLGLCEARANTQRVDLKGSPEWRRPTAPWPSSCPKEAAGGATEEEEGEEEGE